MAILTAVGFFVFALLGTAQLTRHHVSADPARGKPSRPEAELRGSLAVWAPGRPSRAGGGGVGQARRPTANSIRAPEAALVLATVAVIAITVALLVGAVTRRSAVPQGGHDVVVPSWRD
jgi:hypothetical protein